MADEAYARFRAAEALVPAGDRAEADGQIRLAFPVFADLGATAWTAHAQWLLSAQPRRRLRCRLRMRGLACTSV